MDGDGGVFVSDSGLDASFKPTGTDAIDRILDGPVQLVLHGGEVAIAQNRAASLEALVVHREALDGELLDDARAHLRNCTARSELTL
jgi:hypothetical protein